jgi:hypothetical protein
MEKNGIRIRSILISSCGQPISGGPPDCGLGEGLTTSHSKKNLVTKCYTGSGNWMDSLEILVRMDLREIGWESVDWMHLAYHREQWRAVVNTVMNLRVP